MIGGFGGAAPALWLVLKISGCWGRQRTTRVASLWLGFWQGVQKPDYLRL